MGLLKFLRKNEFRYDTNPKVRKKNGQQHTVYITAKKNHKAKANVITHSKEFFNKPTKPLTQNPERSKPSTRQSRFSIPFWENDNYLKNKPNGTWKMSKKDNRTIRKANKKYEKTGKW